MVVIAALLIGSAVLPAIAHALKPAYFPASFASSLDPVVFGSPTLTGILVVADDETLRTDVPSVHLSNFTEALDQIGPDMYKLLMPSGLPPVPVGLVMTASRADGQLSTDYFFAPDTVLSRKDVPAWRFHAASSGHLKNMNAFRLVTEAEPLQLDTTTPP